MPTGMRTSLRPAVGATSLPETLVALHGGEDAGGEPPGDAGEVGEAGDGVRDGEAHGERGSSSCSEPRRIPPPTSSSPSGSNRRSLATFAASSAILASCTAIISRTASSDGARSAPLPVACLWCGAANALVT